MLYRIEIILFSIKMYWLLNKTMMDAIIMAELMSIYSENSDIYVYLDLQDIKAEKSKVLK